MPVYQGSDIGGASDTEFMRKGGHDPLHHAEPNPLLKSAMTGLEQGVSAEGWAQGVPVRKTHRMPLRTTDDFPRSPSAITSFPGPRN